MGFFAVHDADCVFRIETVRKCGRYRCLPFGNSDTLIEMTLDRDHDWIIEIECFYLGGVFREPALKPPDRRSNPELREYHTAVCYEDPTKTRLPCMVNLTRDELALIFFSKCEPKFYVVHDRVEYYYSSEFDLLYIKVVDLTAEEFAFLNCFAN